MYFISDNHFGHWNINKFCNRGFETLDDMNYIMINKWNLTNPLSSLRSIIYCGDFGNLDYLNNLSYNDLKFIKGNHDSAKELQQCLENGLIDEIHNKLWINYSGYNILVSHKPLITDKMLKEILTNNPDLDYDIRKSYETVSESMYNSFNLNIHGHIHVSELEQLDWTNKHFNVCVEKINYTPIHINEILYRMFGVKIC